MKVYFFCGGAEQDGNQPQKNSKDTSTNLQPNILPAFRSPLGRPRVGRWRRSVDFNTREFTPWRHLLFVHWHLPGVFSPGAPELHLEHRSGLSGWTEALGPLLQAYVASETWTGKSTRVRLVSLHPAGNLARTTQLQLKQHGASFQDPWCKVVALNSCTVNPARMGEGGGEVGEEVAGEGGWGVGRGRHWQYNQMHVVMSASPINTHVLCVY